MSGSWYDPKNGNKPVIPAGEYEAEIIGAEHTTSKQMGTPMVKVDLKVFTTDREEFISDYLVASATMTWKIKAFAKALSAEQQFDDGTFDPVNYYGRLVTVTLEVKEDPKYGQQNRIKKYAAVERAAVAVAQRATPASQQASRPATRPGAQVAPIPSDDIPF